MNIEFPKFNNKLAFFDFDRTLVAHDYSKEFEDIHTYNYFMECVWMFTAAEQEHAKDKPLPCMQWYVKKLFDEGYGLYCLTHEIFNLRDKLKQDELKAFYPDTPMTYLTVDKPEHKIDMIKAVATVECCDLGDIIFIDDLMPTVKMAAKEGIDAKHLSDIVVMYENQMLNHEQDKIIKPKGFTDYLKDDSSLLKSEDTKQDDAISEQDEVLSNEELERLYEKCLRCVDEDALFITGKE